MKAVFGHTGLPSKAIINPSQDWNRSSGWANAVRNDSLQSGGELQIDLFDGFRGVYLDSHRLPDGAMSYQKQFVDIVPAIN